MFSKGSTKRVFFKLPPSLCSEWELWSGGREKERMREREWFSVLIASDLDKGLGFYLCSSITWRCMHVAILGAVVVVAFQFVRYSFCHGGRNIAVRICMCLGTYYS